jgi:hypothetical protein
MTLDELRARDPLTAAVSNYSLMTRNHAVLLYHWLKAKDELDVAQLLASRDPEAALHAQRHVLALDAELDKNALLCTLAESHLVAAIRGELSTAHAYQDLESHVTGTTP